MSGIHLNTYHEGVISWIKKELPWLNFVESYPEKSKALNTPGCFFAVRDFERASKQAMNGTLTVTLDCLLLAVLGIADTKYQLEVRNAAMAIALKVDGSRFGLPISPAIFTSAGEDAFETDLDEYAVWAIEFKQDVEVGEDVFKPSSTTPNKVFSGFSPDIGTGNTDLYEQVV